MLATGRNDARGGGLCKSPPSSSSSRYVYSHDPLWQGGPSQNFCGGPFCHARRVVKQATHDTADSHHLRAGAQQFPLTRAPLHCTWFYSPDPSWQGDPSQNFCGGSSCYVIRVAKRIVYKSKVTMGEHRRHPKSVARPLLLQTGPSPNFRSVLSVA